jgi:tetratricopeptide (TPR) repeat protein
MDEKLTSLRKALTVVDGRDVVADPGVAQLRRYLPVLAVIAAPYAGLGGGQDPLNPLDAVGEWRNLCRALADGAAAGDGAGVPLALVRLAPPSSERLAQALAVDGPDMFTVVHLVSHAERDTLHLEDEDGHEAYAVPEHVVRLFAHGRVRLVVLDGCFSQRLAQVLLDETSVQAVAGTRRKVPAASARQFATRFYPRLARGESVQDAFRASLAGLGQADRYELVTDEDLFEVVLPLPPPNLRATRALVGDGLPRMVNVPQPEGFVGRREILGCMARDIPYHDQPAYALTGPVGTGKSMVTAEFANRFGWRFPGGVLWWPANIQTTTREIVAALAQLLELPVYASADELLARLRDRPALLVLDGVDAVTDPAENERLAAFIGRIGAGSGVLLTARTLSAPLRQLEVVQEITLGPLAPKAARTLAMRLAVERDIDALDVDTIDDFLERARNLPWLIARGVRLIETDGIDEALEDLSAYQPERAAPLGLYLGRWLALLAREPARPLDLLIRTQGLPAAFDVALAASLDEDQDVEQQVRILCKHGLLCREGDLLVVPPVVRAQVQQQYAFKAPERARVDHLAMAHLAATWPPLDDPMPLDRALYARLNNTRALLARQMHPDSMFDAAVVTQLLVASALAFRAAGLAAEFLGYAAPIRERLAEDGPDYTRLQVVMGAALSVLPGRQDEAGWMFQIAITLPNLDPNVLAEANQAHGRHLMRVEQYADAEAAFSGAVRPLQLAGRAADMSLAAAVLYDWGQALMAQGRYQEAVPRFQGAMSGYVELQQPEDAIMVQRELAEALQALGQVDRAEDLLRRALASTADRALRGRLRFQLGMLHTARGEQAHRAGDQDASRLEWTTAEMHLIDAVPGLLPEPSLASLGAIFHELARVQGRLSRLADAVANADRARRFFDQVGQWHNMAVSSLTLGQLCMAQGDSVAAQAALHTALDMAAALDNDALVKQIAGVLVRVHHIRMRHAVYADRLFRQNSLDQASFSRAVLADLGLAEHVASLDSVIELVAKSVV